MRVLFFACLLLALLSTVAWAAYGDHDGPFGENDGIHGGKRSNPSAYPADPYIIGWATRVVDWHRTPDITFGVPEDVLGQPGGTFDVFSLGDGGWITVAFDQPITNIPGHDFVVWENGFISRQPGDEGLLWAELVFVEVSTNGTDFIRFPSINWVPHPMGGFDCLDPTYVHNLAGKHPNGNDERDEGTPFNLDDLADHPMVLDGTVDLEDINYVRMVDVIGDGSTVDSEGNPLYDPWPTPFGTGGADVDAVGILSVSASPLAPQPTSPENEAVNQDLTPLLETAAYSEPDGDDHSESWWQVSTSDYWEDLDKYVFDSRSTTQLTTMRIPYNILSESKIYFWRVQFFDTRDAGSGWSTTFNFTTRELLADEIEDADGDGVPDAQQNVLITDIDFMDGDDRLQPDIKTLRTIVGDIHAGLKVSSDVEKIESFRSIDFMEIQDLGNKPGNLPYGAVEFKLKVDIGAEVNVSIYLTEEFDTSFRWFEYMPANGWRDYFKHATIIPIGGGRTCISFGLIDGGRGDADGIKNGWILNTGGIGTPASSSTSTEADFRGLGGCFIESMRPHFQYNSTGRL